MHSPRKLRLLGYGGGVALHQHVRRQVLVLNVWRAGREAGSGKAASHSLFMAARASGILT